MKKRMFMALAVALTGVSMVVAAGNGELKIQSETSVQKVHAAEIHQIGVPNADPGYLDQSYH